MAVKRVMNSDQKIQKDVLEQTDEEVMFYLDTLRELRKAG